MFYDGMGIDSCYWQIWVLQLRSCSGLWDFFSFRNTGYLTKKGQSNCFTLDIVYAVSSVSTKITSLIDPNADIAVVTIGGLIADKINACQQFKGSSTRMKDFVDLWRISQFEKISGNWESLMNLLVSRGLEAN